MYVSGNELRIIPAQDPKNIHNLLKLSNLLMAFLVFFQEVGGSIFVRCKEGKDCPSKCKDKEIIFNLGDQGSNQCPDFKLSTLVSEARKRYKLDQGQWTCSNNHVVAGVGEGKSA